MVSGSSTVAELALVLCAHAYEYSRGDWESESTQCSHRTVKEVEKETPAGGVTAHTPPLGEGSTSMLIAAVDHSGCESGVAYLQAENVRPSH